MHRERGERADHDEPPGVPVGEVARQRERLAAALPAVVAHEDALQADHAGDRTPPAPPRGDAADRLRRRPDERASPAPYRRPMSRCPRPAVLVAGAGVAGIEAVLALRALAGDRVDVRWLAPDRHLAYRPLAVSEPFGLEPVRRVALERLAARHDVRLHHGALLGIAPDERVAFTEDARELPYDAALLATGAHHAAAVAYRGEQDAARVGGLVAELAAGRLRRLALVAPAGVRWPCRCTTELLAAEAGTSLV